MESMSIKELKAAIEGAGMSHVGITEKSELRALARLALSSGAAYDKAPPAIKQLDDGIRQGQTAAFAAVINGSSPFSNEELFAAGLVDACLHHFSDYPRIRDGPPPASAPRSSGDGTP
eukprot:4254090-Prymnesium_polylepis.1